MMRRRTFLAAGAAAALHGPARAAELREDLVARARRLSREPHRPTGMALPPPFDTLGYDSYRAIRPRKGRAAGLDIGDGMVADLLPPGFYHTDHVEIVLPGRDGPVPFDAAMFDYAPAHFDAPPELTPAQAEKLGFSGLRLRESLNSPGVLDEFLVIQGASYFRALARDTVYGLSARGLAIGTGGAEPEEFPVFTRVEVARAHEGAVQWGALIESPSATGALLCVTRPGAPTRMDAELVLFPRETLTEAGIAPLTSMYFFGPNDSGVDDFRPAVHDSDVLWMHNGAGEYLWRPLGNAEQLRTSAFADERPRGFGLLQTARRFEDFQDAEAAYHRRPSAIVRPRGDWGAGAVRLVEIPTRDEFLDNIVAFWRPETPLRAGGEYRFRYDLDWRDGGAPSDGLAARITASRSGIAPQHRDSRLYVIDFASRSGSSLEALTRRAHAEVQLAGDTAGAIEDVTLYPVSESGTLRCSFRFTPRANQTEAELRLVLRDGSTGMPLAPVWLGRWTRSPA